MIAVRNTLVTHIKECGMMICDSLENNFGISLQPTEIDASVNQSFTTKVGANVEL